jgi:uncharacterized protein YyaL (SSP411 family)
MGGGAGRATEPRRDHRTGREPRAPYHSGMPNRLANETSPYLLQHAHNPVDWYPWGSEALERSKREDKPIFLSIGYAACHWCHVMERESFEDASTAEDLNRDFVAVKVDREERPDLDQVYMSAVQAMTGGGGWPMSVFLTPDGQPFYGGTYFPPQPTHGLPAFRQVLAGVARAWRDERLEVVASAGRMVEALVEQSRAAPAGGATAPTRELLDAATAEIERQFDVRNGGWGSAPKFPQPMTIEYLLRRAATTGDPRPLAVARRSLDAMADGGIHDQLGGGFHRYATDAVWLVPHFEQMLYDNAQLARAYVHAWEATGDDRYRDVATGTLDYLLRELRRDDGTFAASQDADTDGEEGGTFVWEAAEIREVLGDDAPAFSAAYDVTDDGNWEGRTILRRVTPPADAGPEARLADARARLLARRRARPQPARDDKALAAWNGLAIGALADAGRLGEPRFVDAAVAAAEQILAGLRRPDGRLGRSWKDGRSTGEGVLEDYANLADGLLALYQTTFDERWFATARDLADAILAHFTDPAGGFFDTADDHETLVTRPKDVQDNAVPSGSSTAALVLLRLAALTGESRYGEVAEAAISTVTPYLGRYPTGFASWLSAAHLAVEGIDELAIVGDPGDPATHALVGAGLLAARETGRNLVVAVSAGPDASAIPLLAGRAMIDGRPTAYLCRDFACRLPVTDPEALRAEFERAASHPTLASPIEP